MRSLKEMMKDSVKHTFQEWSDLKYKAGANEWKEHCRPLISHISISGEHLLILGLPGVLNIWIKEKKIC